MEEVYASVLDDLVKYDHFLIILNRLLYLELICFGTVNINRIRILTLFASRYTK